MEIYLEGINYDNLGYACDTGLIADSAEKLQRLMDMALRESEGIRWKINCQRTYVIATSKKAQIPKCHVTLNGLQIEQVNRFKYLGSWMISWGRGIC